MGDYRLKHIVIKPTLMCTANCPTCKRRRDLHRQLSKSDLLSLDQWREILKSANDLGTERLDLSGGEPTLYKNLVELIKIGKSYGWHVNMNSNGSMITEDYAKSMLDAGLNSLYISIYGSTPEIHESMKRQKNLWSKATEAVRIFDRLSTSYPSFKINTQTFICKNNYKELPGLIRLNREIGTNEMAFSYLEGDFEKELLLDQKEIIEFRNEVIPEALKAVSDLPLEIRDRAETAIKNIYLDMLTIDQWASGLYQPVENKSPKCERPQWFAIILANGDVHPCNMIEYSHDPIVGNVLKNTLKEVWNSDEFNSFRDNDFKYCELCPINLYTIIPLK